MVVELSRIKEHLNIDSAYTNDDEYLQSLESVACELVEKHIDRKFSDIIDAEGEIPKPLLHTILLFVAKFYDNREPDAYTNVTEVPQSLSYILSMYRDYDDSNI